MTPGPQSITELSSRHHLALLMDVGGATPREIGEVLKLKGSAVRRIQTTALYVAARDELLKRLRAQQVTSLADLLKREAEPSIRTLADLRDNAAEDNVRRAAASDLLDRVPETAKRQERSSTGAMLLISDDAMRHMIEVMRELGADPVSRAKPIEVDQFLSQALDSPAPGAAHVDTRDS